VRVSGNLVTSSAAVLRTVLLSGGGLALASPFIAEEELKAGTLVLLLPEYRLVAFAMNAIYPHRRHLAATVRTFIDLSVEQFVEEQGLVDPLIRRTRQQREGDHRFVRRGRQGTHHNAPEAGVPSSLASFPT